MAYKIHKVGISVPSDRGKNQVVVNAIHARGGQLFYERKTILLFNIPRVIRKDNYLCDVGGSGHGSLKDKLRKHMEISQNILIMARQSNSGPPGYEKVCESLYSDVWNLD
jgi:hypothetical protein